MRRPDFIIIGAMKCATSSLHTQLSSHPGIFGSEPKEPNYFSDDAQFAKGEDWYLRLFAGARQTDLVFESSTHYTKLPDYPQTIARMKSMLPGVKLVYVMRHPIDRLVSHYIHQWTQNVIRCEINEAVDRFPELVQYSRYAYQLAPYFEAYGRSAVLPVFFASLKNDPQRELERVARHVGYRGPVHWREEVGRQNASAERIRRFPGYELFIDSAPMAFLRRQLVPQKLRDAVKARLSMKSRPALDAATVQRLEALFDEDLRMLSQWLGTELTCASFEERSSRGDLEWAC